MTGSKEIKQLNAAIFETQQNLAPLVKDSDNPFHESKYASLFAVLDCIQDVAFKNGLMIEQTVDYDEGMGGHILVTAVTHVESGEWKSSTAKLVIDKNNMQGMGSAITYMRRYQLMSWFGLAPVDDDGNEASRPTHQPQQPQYSSQKYIDDAATEDYPKPDDKILNAVTFDQVRAAFNRVENKDQLKTTIKNYTHWMNVKAGPGDKKELGEIIRKLKERFGE